MGTLQQHAEKINCESNDRFTAQIAEGVDVAAKENGCKILEGAGRDSALPARPTNGVDRAFPQALSTP
jgi:hypothetical protein